jgi:hypothetical protein
MGNRNLKWILLREGTVLKAMHAKEHPKSTNWLALSTRDKVQQYCGAAPVDQRPKYGSKHRELEGT